MKKKYLPYVMLLPLILILSTKVKGAVFSNSGSSPSSTINTAPPAGAQGITIWGGPLGGVGSGSGGSSGGGSGGSCQDNGNGNCNGNGNGNNNGNGSGGGTPPGPPPTPECSAFLSWLQSNLDNSSGTINYQKLIQVDNWSTYVKDCPNLQLTFLIAGQAGWTYNSTLGPFGGTGGITILNTTLSKLAAATNTTNSTVVFFEEYIDYAPGFNGAPGTWCGQTNYAGGFSALWLEAGNNNSNSNNITLIGVGGGGGNSVCISGSNSGGGGGGGNDCGQNGFGSSGGGYSVSGGGGGCINSKNQGIGGGGGELNQYGNIWDYGYSGGNWINPADGLSAGSYWNSNGVNGGGGSGSGSGGGGGGGYGGGGGGAIDWWAAQYSSGGGGGGGYCNTNLGTCSAMDYTNGGGNPDNGFIMIGNSNTVECDQFIYQQLPKLNFASTNPNQWNIVTISNWSQYVNDCPNLSITINIAGQGSNAAGGITIIKTTLSQFAKATNTTNDSSVMFTEYVNMGGGSDDGSGTSSNGGGYSALWISDTSGTNEVLLGIGGGGSGTGGGGGNDPGGNSTTIDYGWGCPYVSGYGGHDGIGGNDGGNACGSGINTNGLNWSDGGNGGNGCWCLGGGGGGYGGGSAGGGGGGYCNTAVGTCSASDWKNGGGNSGSGYIQASGSLQ